jgi:hypothetical protein
MTFTSQKLAIAHASAYVSAPCGSRTSWQVYGPYSRYDLDDATTSVNADSYAKARAIRTKWVAQIALCLLGWGESEIYWAIESLYDDGVRSARSIVSIAIKNEEITS